MPDVVKHTVQPGQSVESIAADHGVDPDAIFAANRDLLGSTPANARVGMHLVVPPAPPEPEPAQDGDQDQGGQQTPAGDGGQQEGATSGQP